MLTTGVARNALFKSVDLLDDINIRLWGKIKKQSKLHLLVMLLIKYIQGKIKKRGIQD